MPNRVLSLLLITASLLAGCGGGSDPKFTVAVIGDMPYGTSPTDTVQFLANPAFINAINLDPDVSLVLHVGDIHSGKEYCTEAYDKAVFEQWKAFRIPVVYTPGRSVTEFYGTCFLLGVGIGYWALFVTIAAEQFGTNLRSTVATTVPNFIRGTVILLVPAFQFLRGQFGGDDQAVITGALIVGVFTIGVALVALRAIHETFGRDMNFLEE